MPKNCDKSYAFVKWQLIFFAVVAAAESSWPQVGLLGANARDAQDRRQLQDGDPDAPPEEDPNAACQGSLVLTTQPESATYTVQYSGDNIWTPLPAQDGTGAFQSDLAQCVFTEFSLYFKDNLGDAGQDFQLWTDTSEESVVIFDGGT